MEEMRLAISGMTCSGCGGAVKAALEGLSGVKRAEVNHVDGIATITYDPRLTEVVEMISAVNHLAYQAAVSTNPGTSGGKLETTCHRWDSMR